MKIEFDSREEAKAFHDALIYGLHGIAGITIKINDGKPYYIRNNETGEFAFISSRTAIHMFEDIIERLEKDEYKTDFKRIRFTY